MGEVDEGPHDGGVDGRLRRGRDEGAVDLQLVDLELAQHRQRRVAGAEVVEGDAGARGAQRGQDRRGPARVGQQRRLGDLEGEHAGLEAVLGEDRADGVEQVGVLDEGGGQVHRDTDVVARGAPGGALGGGPLQDPRRQRDHRRGALGEGDERAGTEQTVLGCCQRTSASTPTTRWVPAATICW